MALYGRDRKLYGRLSRNADRDGEEQASGRCSHTRALVTCALRSRRSNFEYKIKCGKEGGGRSSEISQGSSTRRFTLFKIHVPSRTSNEPSFIRDHPRGASRTKRTTSHRSSLRRGLSATSRRSRSSSRSSREAGQQRYGAIRLEIALLLSICHTFAFTRR